MNPEDIDAGAEMKLALARAAAEKMIDNLTVEELTALMYIAIDSCLPRGRGNKREAPAR